MRLTGGVNGGSEGFCGQHRFDLGSWIYFGPVDSADDVVDPCCGAVVEFRLKFLERDIQEVYQLLGVEAIGDLGSEFAAKISNYYGDLSIRDITKRGQY